MPGRAGSRRGGAGSGGARCPAVAPAAAKGENGVILRMWGHAMTSGDGVIVFWEQVVGWGGIPCTARQGAPSARSTSYQQKSATASHRSANSGLWAAHWGVSAPPNMMASEPPTRATCAPAWWAATRPLGRAGCGGVLASGQQQGRSSPSTDCCFSETRLGVPKCPPKPVAHLIKSNTPGP